jgi:hypothetical protein
VAVLAGAAPVLGPLPAAGALVVLAGTAAVAPLRWAAAAALLAYPPLFAVLEPDHLRLVGVGAAYLVLLVRFRATS